jgi:signal transduction histidine kinase
VSQEAILTLVVGFVGGAAVTWATPTCATGAPARTSSRQPWGCARRQRTTLVALEDLTRRAVETVGRNYPSVAFRLDAAHTRILGAPGRVARAVSNLVDNAAKWSPHGGTVEIAVREGTVSVRDHGPGVDPTDLPRVFDRFYRSSRARTMPGSGLGLAIVKQVADSHGGSVTAAAAPGGGALFVLRFPEVADEASVSEPEVRIEFSFSS